MILTIAQRLVRSYTVCRSPRVFCRDNSTVVTQEDRTKVEEDPDLPNVPTNPYVREKRKCILCQHNIEPNYKNVRLLSQFQSRFTGRIYEKHFTGLCSHMQKRVEQEIKKAQDCGLMGVMTKDPRYVDDPELFNVYKPMRPHKY